MSELVQSPAGPRTGPLRKTPESPPVRNHPDEAVERCMTASLRAYNASAAKGKHASECLEAGGHAYRRAKPSSGTLADVLAFTACITQGIHLRIWICKGKWSSSTPPRSTLRRKREPSRKKSSRM